jgi:ribosomal protein S18 acetylase RimI-like enzyme
LTDERLDNPIWHALNTEHARLAAGSGRARRYPAEVVPMAGLQVDEPEALAELRELLAPAESIYVASESLPDCAGLEKLGALLCLQMICPSFKAADGVPDEAAPAVDELTRADAPAMVALTDAAFPGYFRPETYRMGSYYGIRRNGELVAMAGERLALPGLRELSAVCTRPGHTGHGYAARLSSHVLAKHAAAGLTTFLHVADGNRRAIALYERLGFMKRRALLLNRIRRA